MTDPIEQARALSVNLPGYAGGIVREAVAECDRLRAELAAVTAERDQTVEDWQRMRQSVVDIERMIEEVTAERDEAREDCDSATATIARLQGEKSQLMARMEQANIERDWWTRECRRRAESAESALARALEAIPTESTQSLIHAAARGLPLPKRGTEQVHAWLARLDAFRPGQAMTADRAAQRLSFARGNVSIDRDPDARRTVAVEGEP